MYVDDFIKELESWKAPEAEITVDGRDIFRVTASAKGDKLEIITDYLMHDEERDALLAEIEDLKESLEDASGYASGWEDDRIDGLECQVSDLKNVLNRSLSFLRNFRDGKALESRESLINAINLSEIELGKEGEDIFKT